MDTENHTWFDLLSAAASGYLPEEEYPENWWKQRSDNAVDAWAGAGYPSPMEDAKMQDIE